VFPEITLSEIGTVVKTENIPNSPGKLLARVQSFDRTAVHRTEEIFALKKNRRPDPVLFRNSQKATENSTPVEK
jgi:hypothetical protein